MSRVPMRSVPAVADSSPAIVRSRVVLPQPDGPSRAKNSPSWIVRSRASSAFTPPGYTFVTSLISMPGISA